MARFDEIHEFWFQGVTDETPIKNNLDPFHMWFLKSETLDQKIKENFESDLLNAGSENYKSWEASMKGRLALILMWDQFSRNMYRGDPRMFSFDEQALALSLKTMDEGRASELMLIERVFLYLPLEHSEHIHAQELSLKNFQQLVDESAQINPANTPYYKYTLDYAQRHYAIIKRFGRFPHRNAVLGRTSTAEELSFLLQPGSGF